MPERQARVVGDERQVLATELARRYNEGASIRSLAQESGRSYGLTRRLLAEAGVEFRARGGIDPSSPQTAAERRSSRSDDATDQDARADQDAGAAQELADAEARAQAKSRKADKRLSKALRQRAELTKANSSRKQRKSAKKKVSKRRRKADRAAERLQRIREQMASRHRS
ncbi:helix-turn-helix domain-containing protein [Acidipropionibacterium jensenii]|uniref:helix-turn-helix domain-containing protein n=1 Tax=Acidipropionibacterium jensenii TaxID=1749 RepID=UPI00214BA0E7|nr:helix-turn-helix domain-containing protein [Acidipropionibacterium jensenii]